MDIKEITITTLLAVFGILSYHHYDFYKSIFKYLVIGIVLYTLLHFIWHMALNDLLNTIQNDIRPTHMTEIEEIFNVYIGDIGNTLLIYLVAFSILGILYISPQIIKSHPYNKTKKD
jgi:hypothetical protein